MLSNTFDLIHILQIAHFIYNDKCTIKKIILILQFYKFSNRFIQELNKSPTLRVEIFTHFTDSFCCRFILLYFII